MQKNIAQIRVHKWRPIEGEEELRLSYDFLAEENQNWCEKILKNCVSCLTMISQK